MSSFICSKNHYLKVRDLTYYLLKSNKWYLYNIKVTEENLLDYINANIYELYKANIASYNYQYNENIKKSILNELEAKPIEKSYYNDNTLNIEDLIGLYNAYLCILYQIELQINVEFVNNMKLLISHNIIHKIEDKYNCNRWEYEE